MGGEADEVKWRGVRPVEGIRGVWPERNAAWVYGEKYQAGLGIGIVYTVPAGKILFISSAFLTSRKSTDSSKGGSLAIRGVGDVRLSYLFNHLYDLAGQQTSSLSYPVAIQAATGWDVYVDSTDDTVDLLGCIQGWIEDA